MILTACAGKQAQQLARIDSAAAQIGAQRAGDNLPDYPPYCRELMPVVEPKLNEPIDGPQKRWMIVRQNINEKIEWCAGHYDTIQKSRRPRGQT
ncbi:hypothetical protein [Rhizobium leguminosarum]|uniref:hypothetical protein n=1 Tax=Rhizobium leguminosarum TaxID=384 RepID=UPI000B92C546|nr:hypothetical protein [Rhizobium leguminosarum]ASS56901.1 hypothetical protein CHR56_21390 [Rhizobium leguminosarum bv. viciae]